MLSLELRVIEGNLRLREHTPLALNTIKGAYNNEEKKGSKRRRNNTKEGSRRGLVWQELKGDQYIIIDYDEEQNRLMVKLMDGKSHELIRILRNDEAKGIIESLGQVKGLIVDAYA